MTTTVEMPDGVTLIGYADDLALIAVGRSGTLLKHKINTALVDLTEWLTAKELWISPEKTEVILLSGRRKLKEIGVTVGKEEIYSKKSLKYLGVIFDKDVKMTEHVRQVVTRINEVATKLGRLLLNIGGPRSSKRRVLCGAVSSILLYGAQIWGGVMRKEKYRHMLLQVQRKLALRIRSACRTVSMEAAQVLARLIPIDLLLVRERTRAFDTQKGKDNLRRQTLVEWQSRWDLPSVSVSLWTWMFSLLFV